jgi:glycosyltransferase involved in cell wall biosynthesis
LKYLILNPYGRAYGVRTYSENVLRRLDGKTGVACFSNDDNLSFEEFRHKVAEYVTRNYSPAEVVIETPEARAAAVDLDPAYILHVRLHGFGAVGEICNGRQIDQSRLSSELSLIRRASVLSSPSYALLPHIAGIIDTDSVHVFKNPPDPFISAEASVEKTYDVVFMGRYEVQKGSDWLDWLLQQFPAGYKVLLLGPDIHRYKPSSHLNCQIENHGIVHDHSRFELLARAKVFASLSRFENCSMSVLEALASGTVAVCWDVGGNSEIAPPPLVQLVPFGDLNRFADTVREACQTNYPSQTSFQAATSALSKDFDIGWSRAWKEARGKGGTTYRGLDHRSGHRATNPGIPYASPPVSMGDCDVVQSDNENRFLERIAVKQHS